MALRHPLPEPPGKRTGRPPTKRRPDFLGPIRKLHEIPDAVACARCEQLFVPWKGAKYCSLDCFLKENRVVSNGSQLYVTQR